MQEPADPPPRKQLQQAAAAALQRQASLDSGSMVLREGAGGRGGNRRARAGSPAPGRGAEGRGSAVHPGGVYFMPAASAITYVLKFAWHMGFEICPVAGVLGCSDDPCGWMGLKRVCACDAKSIVIALRTCA